ncbi:hypothetical protein HGRIS_002971 [Hohenbuehelia grisea]|uniref:Glutaredoxin domain-containing protein n=1 Tax=Hohenbuehelia grisea TaxID=104357 RepID=A0ABR3JNB2_9AGAR
MPKLPGSPRISGITTLKMRSVSRGAVFALAGLLITATLLLLLQPPDDRAIPYHTPSYASAADVAGIYATRFHRGPNGKLRAATAHKQPQPQQPLKNQNQNHDTTTTKPQMTPVEELAAVTAFLTALATNVLPPAVDPTRPLDPQLVLDFDYDPDRIPGSRTELAALRRELWDRYPVVLYGKHFSAPCRALKSFLNTLSLSPPPTYIDVDTRADTAVLRPLLARLTGVRDLPVLLVGGVVVPYEDGALAVEAVLKENLGLKHEGDDALAVPGANADRESTSPGDASANANTPNANPDAQANKVPAPGALLPVLEEMHKLGKLAPLLADAGAVVGGGKRRGRGRK